MTSYRTNTRELILETYSAKGLNHTIALASALLRSDFFKDNPNEKQTNLVFGKLTEAVLEVCVKDYIRKNKLTSWFYREGVILKDITSDNEEFLTEIDFVLYTPEKVYIFECKGYKGYKIIKDRGIINRKGKNSFDVFKQHKLHVDVFTKTFDSFILSGNKRENSYQAVVFDFSEGSIEDLREDSWKKILPFIGYDALSEMFDKGRVEKVKWNMPKVREVVSIIDKTQESLTIAHLNYVTGLRARRRK